jgi:hypothetical protein
MRMLAAAHTCSLEIYLIVIQVEPSEVDIESKLVVDRLSAHTYPRRLARHSNIEPTYA